MLELPAVGDASHILAYHGLRALARFEERAHFDRCICMDCQIRFLLSICLARCVHQGNVWRVGTRKNKEGLGAAAPGDKDSCPTAILAPWVTAGVSGMGNPLLHPPFNSTAVL